MTSERPAYVPAPPPGHVYVGLGPIISSAELIRIYDNNVTYYGQFASHQDIRRFLLETTVTWEGPAQGYGTNSKHVHYCVRKDSPVYDYLVHKDVIEAPQPPTVYEF